MADGINQVIQQLTDEQINRFSTFPVNDEQNQSIIKEWAGLLSLIDKDLSSRFSDAELKSFRHSKPKVAVTPIHERFRPIAAWMVKRREFIDTLQSTADQLDQSCKTATIGTIISSTIDLFHNIDSLAHHQISDALQQQAHSLSTQLGVASQVFFGFIPYFSYMGWLSSFGDTAYTKYKMMGIKKSAEEDLELFEHAKAWIRDTETLDAEVKKLFPFGMDCDVLVEVEKFLQDYDSWMKVFVVAVYSNISKSPPLARNVKF